MDTMNIPGFTAESALYRSSNPYRSRLSPSQPINGVTPQWCCQDPRDCEQCLSDCTAAGEYPQECGHECFCPCAGLHCP
jgi:hypothetical protein